MHSDHGALARRGLLCAIALTALLAGEVTAQGQTPAAKAVHIIVPTTAGAPPDVVARVVVEGLERVLRQPVIVENRPGAIGSIGLAALSHATADGYTLGLVAMPYVVAPSMIHVPFDFERDFAPVARVTRSYSLLAVRADSRTRTVGDLIARARAHPNTITFASQGNGTPGHLAGVLLERATKTHMVHVPYKANSVAGLLTGDVDFALGPAYTLWPHAQSGKLRVLATTAPKRLEAYPEVPTMAELGYPEVQMVDWQGVLAPKGTPRDVISKLREAIKTVLESTDARQKLASMGMEAAYADSEEFGSLIASELRRWNAVVREAGIKAD